MSARSMAGCLVAVVITGGNLAWASTETVKLTIDDPAHGQFGRSVAIDGDYIAVGAPLGGICPPPPVWIFKRVGTGWEQQAEIPAAVPACDFGISLDLEGDRLVAGGPKIDPAGSSEGEAAVFRRVGDVWSVEGILIPSIRNLRDYFGLSVAISGDVLVVGAPGHEGIVGRAFVFRWDGATWQEEAALTSADAEVGDRFGKSVSIDGNLIVVGAPDDANSGGLDGTVTVFAHNGSTWIEEATLTKEDVPEGASFGRFVSVSGDVLAAVGKQGFVFRRSGTVWLEEMPIVVATVVSLSSVAAGSNSILVGGSQEDSASGAAYLYRGFETQWLQVDRLAPSDPSPGRSVGFDLAMDENQVVLGTLGGSVYVYDLSRQIPTVSTWGILIVAFLLGIAGTILIRRRLPMNTQIMSAAAGCRVPCFSRSESMPMTDS